MVLGVLVGQGTRGAGQPAVGERVPIRFEYLVDDGGTPTDPNDDVLLDQRIIKPGTGLNEFDNADFCADVRQYIG